MKDQKIADKLSTVLIQVLEQTAFLFADRIDDLDDVALHTIDFISVSLDYSGARSGGAVLILPVSLCDEICTNMLGTSDTTSLSEDSRIDAAKELANIVVGQMLTEVFGTAEVFSQTPPMVKPITMEELLALIQSGLYALSVVDDSPVILILTDFERQYEHQSSNC